MEGSKGCEKHRHTGHLARLPIDSVSPDSTIHNGIGVCVACCYEIILRKTKGCCDSVWNKSSMSSFEKGIFRKLLRLSSAWCWGFNSKDHVLSLRAAFLEGEKDNF